MRRQLLALAVMTCLSLMTTGCALRQSAGDLAVQQEQIMIDSENPREMDHEWRRGGWQAEQLKDLTPYRIHGGVGPASSSL